MSKNSNNAFMAFIKFYRQREAKKGTYFANYEQVVQPGGEEWQQMSAEEKKYFRQCAKCCRAASGPYNAYKISDEKDSATKVSHPNRDGNSKRKVKATFCGAMQYSTRNDPQRATTVEIKSIWHLMKNFDVKILENPFYILTVESYEIACKKEIPAEIAFVRFSLKEGIIAAKSFILQPSKIFALSGHYGRKYYCYSQSSISYGQRCRAMRSHKINPLNLCQATNRYRYVAEQIKSLCDSNDPCSFIFTLANDFNEVQRAVKAIRQKIGSQLFAPAERVACVEDLYEILLRFKELKSSAHDLIRFNSIGRNCQWDKEESISRSFNHLNTTTHCALAKARKITYLLFSILQDPHRLELTTKHLPSAIGSKAFDTPELEQEIVEFDEEENLRKLAKEEMKKVRRNGGRFLARLKRRSSQLLTITNGDDNNSFQGSHFENDDYSYTKVSWSQVLMEPESSRFFNRELSDLINFVNYEYAPTSMYISMNTLNSTAACSSFDSSVRENIPMNRFVDLSLDENIAAPMNRQNTKSPSNTTPINLYDNPFLKSKNFRFRGMCFNLPKTPYIFEVFKIARQLMGQHQP